ncbi:MAG TPA: ATP-binding protein, partial [Luteitalea sp.]|nr:ATP-binding protein [Luteitalea sp.]
MGQRAASAATAAIVTSAVVAIATLAAVVAAGAPWLVSGIVGLAAAMQLAVVVTLARRAPLAGRRAADIVPAAPSPVDPSYRRVVDQVEQVLFEADTHGRWTFLNRTWQLMTGRDVAASIGQPLVASLHPDDRFEVEKLSAALLSGQRPDGRIEVRVLTDRDRFVWGDVHMRATGGDGARGIAGTISDVTERRAVAQELESARLAAEKASAAKSEFLKSMSHEMRTPLNGVLGLMELLSTTALDAQQARYVSVARASATHLATLISDILDLSRIEGGGLPLERMLFDLPELIETSVDAVTPEATSRRLRISSVVTPRVPTWVVGDSGRIRQVLVNLLVHAVKFTDQGEIHLQVDAAVDVARREAAVAIAMHDRGTTLSAEHLEGLFEPFASGEAAMARRQSGAGLALTICKHLVEAMGGEIAVRSGEPRTATFTVRLPLEIPDAAMVEDRRSGEAPLRVLAVAAPDTDRAILSRLLEGWHFDAAVVADCDAAWGHVEATSTSRWRFGIALLHTATRGADELADRLRGLAQPPGLIWILAEEVRVVPAFVRPREVVVKSSETTALYEAIMQAVVGATAVQGDRHHAPQWSRPPLVLVAEDHDVNQMVVKE